MSEIGRGQKSTLDQLGCDGPFNLVLALAGPGLAFDLSCFGLDQDGKLSDDRYLVFFNQTSCPGGAVNLTLDGNRASFAIDVSKLPESIQRLVFTASIDGEGAMRSLGVASLSLGTGTFRFSGADFDAEKAIMAGELYRRNGEWRFGAVGQGFNGGLAALLAHFGGSEAAPAPAAPAIAPPAPVSLSKVTLTKPGTSHAISLIKGAAAPARLVVKATWVDNGDGADDNDDLDLRVGILLPDGRMRFIQAPERAGSFETAPYVRHLGDITTATAREPATETVEVNPAIAQLCGGRVALVFSIYSAVGNGDVSVASMMPKMRMEYGQQVVECAFDFSSSKVAAHETAYTYVVGTAIIDGETIVLAPSGQTSEPCSESTPWLKWDGAGFNLTMDGPAVFKGEEAGDEDEASPYRYS